MPEVYTLTVNYDSNIEKVEYNKISGTAYSEIANGGSIPIAGTVIAYLKITPKTGYSVDSVASANYTMTDNGNNVWIWNYAAVAIHESDTVTITSKQGGGSMSKSVDLTTLTGWSSLSDGTHTITIKAKADGYRDSEASAGVEVTKGEQTTTLEAGTYQFIEKPDVRSGLSFQPTENTVKANTLTDDNVYGDMEYVLSIDVVGGLNELNIVTENDEVKYQGGESYDRWLFGCYTATDTSKLRTIIIETDQQVPQSFYDWAITQGNLVKQSTGETWVLNESVNWSTITPASDLTALNVGYYPIVASDIYGDLTHDTFRLNTEDVDASKQKLYIYFGSGSSYALRFNGSSWSAWINGEVGYSAEDSLKARTLTFSTAPTGDLLTWLQANGTKQGG